MARLQLVVVSLLMPGLTIWTSPVKANPAGGVVVHGDVKIGAGAGGNLQIRQNSRNAIINWDTFSIDAGELTQFRQATGPNSAVLNRVTGGDPSAIHGALRANGNVFVINPNGILVGPGGTIDVRGVVLSTLDVSNGEFLAGGDMNFKGVGKDVTNLGRINAVGGDVFLIGKTVSNSGSIRADGGTVGLAAGEEVLLAADEGASGERIFVRATGAGVSGTGVSNDGTIEGAAVELKAHGNMYALAINNKGSVRATGATTSGGRVYLRGAGGSVSNSGSIRAASSGSGSGGRVLIEAAYAKVDGMIRAQGGEVRVAGGAKGELGGRIDASSSVGRGGDVVVEGDEIAVGATASVDVSGSTGGGNVRIGGGFQGRDASVRNADTLTVARGSAIRADATESGKGGNVILWADGDTLFEGDVSAHGVSRGGFAEISGKGNLGFDGLVDVLADRGSAGTVLLDPTNVTVSSQTAAANIVNNLALSNLLDLGNNVVISTNFGGLDPGNIVVGRTTDQATANGDRVDWYFDPRDPDGAGPLTAPAAPGTLTFLAIGNVTFNTSVRSAGSGGINVVAGWDGITGLVDPLDADAQTDNAVFDMGAVLATMPGGSSAAALDAAGVGAGSIFVNVSNGPTAVEVGSRFGATQFAAHDILLKASDSGDERFAHVGFRDTGYEFELATDNNGLRNEWWASPATATPTNGNVQGKGYIDFFTPSGGTYLDALAAGFRPAGSGATGAITLRASGRIDLRSGDDNRSYVQIGHGGSVQEGFENQRVATTRETLTTRDGIVMDPIDNNWQFFGSTWRTNTEANPYRGLINRIDAPITLHSGEEVLVMAAFNFDNLRRDLTNEDGSAGMYALVGHGGSENWGSFHGDVSVTADGVVTDTAAGRVGGAGVEIRGGRGSNSFAQIGHGTHGEGNRRTIYDLTKSGNVTVIATTGGVRMLGFNQMPRTGGVNTGVYLDPNTPTQLGSGADDPSFFNGVQIGHGGYLSAGPEVLAVNDDGAASGLTYAAGTLPARDLIPGFKERPDASMLGNINVFAGGTMTLRDIGDTGPGIDPLFAPGTNRQVGLQIWAGNGQGAYGQIGHGGINHFSNNGLVAANNGGTELQGGILTGTRGDISVVADQGGILAVGGEERRSSQDDGFGFNFVQIGHGGSNVSNFRDDNGNTTTTATLQWDFNAGFEGNIDVMAGQGAGAPAGAGDILFRSGRMRQSWAMIGHGGSDSRANIAGDGTSNIGVTASGTIEFTSRESGPTEFWLSRDYVDARVVDLNASGVGELMNFAGTAGTATRIPQTGTVRAYAYDTQVKFAKVGHGGNNFSESNNVLNLYSLNNSVTVTAQGGGVAFTAGDRDVDFIQIGHGGYDGTGNSTLNEASVAGGGILVTAAGDIVFDASNAGLVAQQRTTNLGVPVFDGSGNVIGLGGVTDRAFGFGTFAMIGHGGREIDGDFSGDIDVTATNGGNLHMIGAAGATVTRVDGFTGRFLEGPSSETGMFGAAHAQTDLVEATMKARSFTLFHGNSGAATIRGAIVPGTVRIDSDNPDLGDFDGDGLLKNASGGSVYGTVDYATGRVTIFDRVRTDDNSFQRNIDYSYNNGGSPQAIDDERSPESDAALRANQAYLGHGGILPGSVSIVIDADNNGGGRKVFTDPFGNGVLYNEQTLAVGSIDYNSGRLIFEGVNTATGDSDADGEFDLGTAVLLRAPLNSRTSPDEVSASYAFTSGSSDQGFVQLGHGGYSSAIGGRNSAGNFGAITVNAAGDVRFHGGQFDASYAQLGHGGWTTQSAHGFQGDPGAATAGTPWGSAPRTSTAALDATPTGNITVNAGGIVEFLSGRGISYWDDHQYSQLGHGGYDSDGHHQGNIRVTAGTGEISVAPGIIGGSGETGGIVFTAGQARDAYTQLGHGGFGTRAARADGDAGARGFTGLIDVNAAGDIRFTSGTSLMNLYDYDDVRLYSQLGHGGYDADVRHDGGTQLRGTGLGHSGDITVNSGGSILFQAGDERVAAPGSASSLGDGYGILHYTHLGHGGYSAQGDHSGNITVTAANDILFNGGSRTHDDSTDKRNYALLGHGGDESDGFNGARDGANNPTETISVTATGGDIRFTGGEGRRNWVQLGHGGFQNNGDHVANVVVNAGGDISFVGGVGSADQINGEKSLTIDYATYAAGGPGSGFAGWTSLRSRNLFVPQLNFTITVDGFSYFANGSTFVAADGGDDGANDAAYIVASTNVDFFPPDSVIDIPAGTRVGELNLRTGQVRFYRDLDPRDTMAFTASYRQGDNNAATANNATENQTTNPFLTQAIQGPASFLANSPTLLVSFNNTQGGITNVTAAPNAPYADKVGIEAGSLRLSVPDGTVVVDNGGALQVQTAAAGSGLTVGQTVGTIDYLLGQIALTTSINPNGIQGTSADYRLDRVVGSDLSYAQLGNGGYNADVPDGGGPPGGGAFSLSNRGNLTVTSGGDIRFHGGDGASAYTQLGHGGDSNHGGNTGDLTVTGAGLVEFLGGRGADLTDSRSYAQLGHGGFDADGNHSGNIVVNAGSGTV